MASLLSRIGGQIRSALTRTSSQAYDRSLYAYRNPGMPVAQVPITEHAALTISAIYAGCRAISEDIAGIDLDMFRRSGDGSKTRADDHPLAYIIDRKPNREISSHSFTQALIACSMLWGNGYAEIERDASGRPLALWLLDPRDIQPQRDVQGVLHYVWQGSVRLELEDVIHLKGFSLTGILGEMTIRLAKEGLSLSKAYEHFAGAIFGNGARPGGIFKYPVGATLNEQAKNKILNEQREIHGHAENAGKNMILPAGWEYEQFDTNNEQNQFLQSRTFSLDEVARWLRCPPSKLANLTKISYSSLEYQSMEYVNDALKPWMVKLQHEYENKLLTRAEQMVYEIRFDPSELLRASALERAQTNQVLFQNGVLCPDEWRAKEGKNPLPDGAGKIFFTNLNLIPINKLVNGPAPAVTPPAATPAANPSEGEVANDTEINASADDSSVAERSVRLRGVIEAIRPSLVEEVGRLLRVETDKAIRSAKQGTIPTHVAEFYPKHEGHIRTALERVVGVPQAALEAVGKKLDTRSAVSDCAKRMVEASKSDLQDTDGLSQRVEGWASGRSEMIADDFIESLIEQAGA